ncbi:hypothetical protein CTAYLR_010116 [Chrysophaeum taylorii]|uniref:EamA domain-containing protein n=1 Tax=Chrysophaeum taylorii TaxID=2483200 RepID=A0AAD7XMD6_9STRA|nr:hypothetical protein CTAYLR_010116 [Chrysophaeum taylorii]
MGQEPTPRVVVCGTALLVQLAFAGWHVLGGIALSGSHKVNPLVFALYREAGASFMMFCAGIAIEGRERLLSPVRRILGGDARTGILFCGAGAASFCNVVGTVVALTLIPSDVYATYQPTIPVFTTAIATAVGYETPNTLIVAGVLVSVVGAILVELFEAEGGSGSLAGNLLVVGQCLGMSTLVVLTKPLLRDYTALTVTAGYYCTGSFFTLVALLSASLPIRDFWWTAPEPWAALIYAILIATFFCYEAYSWLVERSSPTFAAAFCPMQPVFTVLLNFLALGDGLGAPTAAAGLVVVTGLALTVYGKFRRDDNATKVARRRPREEEEEEGEERPVDLDDDPAVYTPLEEEEEEEEEAAAAAGTATAAAAAAVA